MNHDTKPETILKASLDLQAQRITAIRMFTKAAIVTRSVDSTQLSLAMNPNVVAASNAKRIGRLLEQVTLSAADKQHFILGNQSSVRVSFDRTEWDFGSVTNNLLTAAVEVNGLAVPVHTKDLVGCGSSGDDARIQAVDDTLNVIPISKIEVFTVDREWACQGFVVLPHSCCNDRNAVLDCVPCSPSFLGSPRFCLRCKFSVKLKSCFAVL